MRNRGTWPIAFAVTVAFLGAVLGAACGRDKLAALDDAYKSGVLTKAEYDAKRAALVAPGQMAALDDAYKSGVLTKAEYDAKRAALAGSAAPAAAAAYTPAASAPGVTGPAAYTPGVAAPAASAPAASAPGVTGPGVTGPEVTGPGPATPAAYTPVAPASAPVAPAAAHTGYLVMKKAVAIDQSGFERPMPTLSVLVPVDWQSQGATQWNMKDNCNTIQTHLAASGPDGRGIEIFPHHAWAWADKPAFLQQDYQQKARMGTHACDVMPPMSAADFLRQNVSRVRPNAQIVGFEPMPKLMETLQQQARQTEQQAMQYRLVQRVRSDVARARLRYSLNGQSVEEWLVVITTATGTQGPFGFTYNCDAMSYAVRAPQGQLDASLKFYEMVVASTRINPEWQARINGVSANIFNSEHKEIAKRTEINTKLGEDLSIIRRQSWDYKQKSEDHVFGQMSQTTLGVETYRNPASGETFDFSNTYSHAWVNDRNEFVLSDQEGWDPNTAIKGNWHALEHVRQ